MKRVLHVLDGLGRGGAQAFIMNNIEELYNNGIVCDFLIRRDNSEYTEMITQYSGKVFLTSPFPKAFIKNSIQTRKFMKKHGRDYCAVHIHANALLYLLPLKLAKKYEIPVRVIHSHSTKTNVKWLKIFHVINRKRISHWANVFLACGEAAGRWMFNNKKFEIIKNCIDEKKFKFDLTNRDKIRKEYNINPDCTLIGHVGAFKLPKNHKFIVKIYKEYLKINKNSRIIFLGVGALEKEIRTLVKNEGISDYVIFAGAKGEIYRYYHAMDVFLFPSLFEGLPFSLIEAQMSGLPSLISNNITDEVVVTDLIVKKSLDENEQNWARELEKMLSKEICREKYVDYVCQAGFGISVTAKRLAEIYTGEQ